MGAGLSVEAQKPEVSYTWLLQYKDSLIKYASHTSLETFTANGTKCLAVAYHASVAPNEGSPSQHIRFALSKDGGETWTASKVVVWSLAPVWNPVMFFHSNRLHLLYCESRKAYSPGGDIKIIHSTNCGDTWSAPITIYTHEEDGEVPKVVANRPAIGPEGTWYLPFHTEPADSFRVFNAKTWHPLREAGNALLAIEPPPASSAQGLVTVAGCLISKDQGASWTVGGIIEDAKTWLIQPIIECIGENELYMLLRTSGKIYKSRSTDGGTTWTAATPSALANPNSKFSTVTMDGQILLAHNPSTSDHKSLILTLSVDGGKRWEVLCIVDQEATDPNAILCNPSIIGWTDDTVKVAYTVWGKGLKLATLKLVTVDT